MLVGVRVTSVRIGYHFRKGGQPVGLAVVDHVPQGCLEFPDLPFRLPIHLVVAGRSHDGSTPIVLRICFQNLEVNRGPASLTIEVGTPLGVKYGA